MIADVIAATSLAVCLAASGCYVETATLRVRDPAAISVYANQSPVAILSAGRDEARVAVPITTRGRLSTSTASLVRENGGSIVLEEVPIVGPSGVLGDSIPWYGEGTLFGGAPTIHGTSARVPLVWGIGRHSHLSLALETALVNVCVLGTRREPDRNLGIVSTLFGAGIVALSAAFAVAMATSDLRDPAAVRSMIEAGGVTGGVGAGFVGIGLWHLVAPARDTAQIRGACPVR